MSLESDIISLRREKGLSCTRIYYTVRESYKVTRNQVKDILKDSGLMPRNLTHGGYRPGSGRGDKFLLDGDIFDSYAELCFYLKYRDSLGLKKNLESFSVGDYNYTPDFRDREGNYYEVKSSSSDDFWGWNYIKLREFDKPLTVITKEELIPVILEVEKLYSREYLSSLLHLGSWRDTQAVEGSALEKR